MTTAPPPEAKARIAIIGGGPSGLFLYKRLIESGRKNIAIDIFEKKNQLGAGMPYSAAGAGAEHITNVSGNEIPELVTPVTQWLAALPESDLEKFSIDRGHFSAFKVLPRLLFGKYLEDQFGLLQQSAARQGIATAIHFGAAVDDIAVTDAEEKIVIHVAGKAPMEFDYAIICIGHHWPLTQEGKVAGYFDSPYPPEKLPLLLNHDVAIKGSSLTAIDAVRTLARRNGVFKAEAAGGLSFHSHPEAQNFRLVLHSRHGFLPCVRFHLSDSHLSGKSKLSAEEIAQHRKENGGFVSLDFIFEKDFKDSFRETDPAFYEEIRDMSLEGFVALVMDMRAHADPFRLLEEEYAEAKESIRRQESVYWKEMLAVLSFAMNYPAKHFSAEDMLRLQKTLMPLISVVIAFVPQSSCEELMALRQAGKIELVAVDEKSRIEAVPEGGIVYHFTDEGGEERARRYKTYIDGTGQRHLPLEDFPFKSLVTQGAAGPARMKFRSAELAREMMAQEHPGIQEEGGDFFLPVPGIAITDNFQPVSRQGGFCARLYIMAVPYIGGHNPDYSGLDFCEEASRIIVGDLSLRLRLRLRP